MNYVKRYIGSALEVEVLCVPCADERAKGLPVDTADVCEECFEYATTEIGDLIGTRGSPEIPICHEYFRSDVKETVVPKHAGSIVDIAPVDCGGRSVWLMLTEDGVLIRFDADRGELDRVASVNVPAESEQEPWAGHLLRRRLHASSSGGFAAVVNDYGRYGTVIDLTSGAVTLQLDGGDDNSETVPFSFAFAELNGRTVAIHRTDWNRLDVSDPSTGRLLSVRGPTSYRQGETQPEHYLDYFHGAIYVSPRCSHIVDDGWVWHPVGMPASWSLERWPTDNVWESDDGSTKRYLCNRDYYWDHAVTWIDEDRVAIGGIGDDDELMIDGARVFDIASPGGDRDRCQSARELRAFAGPAGSFFSDGRWLYSADERGLSRWDVSTGVRTGHIPQLQPAHHHRSAGELVQLLNGTLVRLSILPGDAE